MGEHLSSTFVSLKNYASGKFEDVRKNLNREKGVEGWDNFNSVMQRSLNFLSPKDLQYQLPQGMIDKMRELLLNATQATEGFRNDVAALLQPVKFIQEDTLDQVESVIMAEAFGVKEKRRPTLTVASFFRKYAKMLGYEPLEKKKSKIDSGDSADQLSETQKRTLSILKYRENPAAGDQALVDAAAVHEKFINPKEGDKTKSRNAIQTAKRRVLLLQKIQTEGVKKTIDKKKVLQELLDLLKATPDKLFDAVMARAIEELQVARDLLDDKILTQLMDAGHDNALANAIVNTDAGKKFVKNPRHLQAIIDKRMDRAATAAIISYDIKTKTMKNKEVLAFINDPQVIQSMRNGGMAAALQAVSFLGNETTAGKNFLAKNPDWEKDCKAVDKSKALVFKEIGAPPVFGLAA